MNTKTGNLSGAYVESIPDNNTRHINIGRYVFDPENENRMIPRMEILQHFWPGDDPVFSSRSLDVFISKLRKYLSEDQSVKIVNERGKGLRLLTDN